MATTWLDELRPEEVDRLRRSTTRRECAAGEVILRPGCAADSVFFVDRGLVRLYRLGSTGRAATLGYVRVGEVFGESDPLPGGDCDSYAQAVRASVVLRVGRETFEDLLGAHPSLLAEVARQFAARLKRLENRCEDLMLRDTRERIARLLLELAADFGRDARGGLVIALRVNQSDLATAIGATRQSVNACLRAMQAAGFIAYERGRLTILRPDDLRASVPSR